MSLSFEPVTLDGDAPDRNGMLVYRDGRLLAVLTCLSDIHADLAGKWYVEATFGDVPIGQPPVFDTTDRFGEWSMNSD